MLPKRLSAIVLAVLATGILWTGARKAASQQENEPKQTLVIGYPNPAIVINGSGTRYNGIIYVKVFAITPALVRKSGPGPIATAELAPSQRHISQLPLGEYEVQYAMRTGSELKTFIVRHVILRPEQATALTVEMNADAKTTIVGGDMSAQQMEDSIRQLMSEVASLKREVAELKRK
jgi:hypothetical protein